MWDYIPQITCCEIQQRSFNINFAKVLFTGLKYKKALTAIKGKSAFQTIAIELYKQPKETNRNYFSRLVISSIRVSVVSKTDDEVYVSSTIKMYSYFSFVFSTVPKKVQLLKILESDVGTLKIITTMKKWYRRTQYFF